MGLIWRVHVLLLASVKDVGLAGVAPPLPALSIASTSTPKDPAAMVALGKTAMVVPEVASVPVPRAFTEIAPKAGSVTMQSRPQRSANL